MTDKVLYFIMVPMVYASLLIFLLGLVYSFIIIKKAPVHPVTLRIFPVESASRLRGIVEAFTMPTIRRDSPVFWVFLVLYHMAFFTLIACHIDLVPGINLMAPDSIHMIGYGSVGLVLTVSVLYFLFRRFKSPVREISTPGDYLILLILFLIFITGDVISWSNSWNENGFVIGKADFKKYFKILIDFTFQDPREVLQGSHYIVAAVHVFLANIFIMLFPFTKFVHTFLALPVNKLRRG